MSLQIDLMSKEDFYFIRSNLKDYWGDRYKIFIPLHHPLFFYSFGNTAFVIKENGDICAYMLAFYSQKEPKAYVHMINVKKKYRSRGYGKALYDNLIDLARKQGCNSISAITTVENELSINFHKKIGMKLLGEPSENGIPVIKNYSGYGEDRVVFEMPI